MGYQIIENRKLFNGCGDWYEWSIENWGTKWEACDVKISNQVIRFETAWSPCSPIVEKLSLLYPSLLLDYRYFEPGIGLAGKERYLGGECIEIYIYDCEEDDYRQIGEEFGYVFP